MSKVPYTVNVDEYVCSELEVIRKMDKTRDYSGLMSCVERIQFHVSRMEDALYTYEGFKQVFKGQDWSGDMDDEDLVKAVKRLIKEHKEEN